MAIYYQPILNCMSGASMTGYGTYVTIPVATSSAITSATTVVITSVGNAAFGVQDMKICCEDDTWGNKIGVYRQMMDYAVRKQTICNSQSNATSITIDWNTGTGNCPGLATDDYAAICIAMGQRVAIRQKTPEEKIREIIEQRQAPLVFTHSGKSKVTPLPDTTDVRELRARDLVRRILGEHHYQQLCEKGHVAIKAKSGKTYVLRPGYANTTVYEGGRKVASLCIQLSGSFPPCDALAMRAMLLWNNEAEFWKKSNAQLFKDTDPLPISPNPLHGKTLMEHFAEAKANYSGSRKFPAFTHAVA